MNESFARFISQFKSRLSDLFHNESDINELSLKRGLPQEMWKGIMDLKPLSVAVPTEFNGRGVKVEECLSILSAASYESLPLSLTFGINIALFLEPMARYGDEELKKVVFRRFIEEQAMGGLMITEPDYGSDALNMRTAYEQVAEGYTLKGQKHWQGLTGMADFWIVAARKKLEGGDLARDVEFFVTDNSKAEQKIIVEQYFNNPGLYMIPYGLNTIDVTVPTNQKLILQSTGLKMMLDILHRSRLQFPGMGMGFIQRMLDESLRHCQNRKVGANPLTALDSVQYQLSRIQSSYTLTSGMCAKSTSISGIEFDLSGKGLEANSMKALVTDMMQEAAQICVQLAGSSGYKIEHIGGRGIMDSRPFQIFEGSNEMLYTQIAEIVLKQMRKSKETNFSKFLNQLEQTKLVADRFNKTLDFDLVADTLAQRQMVLIGQIVARLVCLQYVNEMVAKGFRQDLYDNCCKHMEMDVKKITSDLSCRNNAVSIVEYQEGSNWIDFI